MINRVFFILDQELTSGRNLLLPEENVFYSVTAHPAALSSLQQAYTFMSDTAIPDLALTLDIRAPLTADNIRSIAAFLFLPAYLQLAGRPVILLAGDQAALLRDSAASLSSYLSGQGFGQLLIHVLLPDDSFRSAEALGRHYEGLLRSGPCYSQTLFFNLDRPENLQSVLAPLRQAELAFRRQSSQLYSLILAHGLLEEKFTALDRKYAATTTELQHQQQYIDILRSGHAAKEIQDFYSKEYEILPLWYKRFGQVLKVLTGKRTFRSLFRDDIKKYKI